MSTRGHCTLGVGCEQAGVCYAAAHNQPDQCGWVEDEAPPLTSETFDAMLDRIQQKEPRDETESNR